MYHLIFESFLDQPDEVALFFTMMLIPILQELYSYLFVFFPFLECKLKKMCVYPTPRVEDGRALTVPTHFCLHSLSKRLGGKQVKMICL